MPEIPVRVPLGTGRVGPEGLHKASKENNCVWFYKIVYITKYVLEKRFFSLFVFPNFLGYAFSFLF